MTGDELPRHAAAVVRDRRRRYGDPAELFGRAAVRWSRVLGTKVTPAQVVRCLIDLKVARLARHPEHAGSLVDVAGDAACLAEVGR